MLKKRSQFFLTGLFFLDLLLVSSCWIGSVHLIHHLDPRRVRLIPSGYESPYFVVLPLVALVTAVAFWYAGLYRPRRTGTFLSEVGDISKAIGFVVLVLVAMPFFLPRQAPPEIQPQPMPDRLAEMSRYVVAVFALSSAAAVAAARGIIRKILWELREHGRNLRYVLVVGAGKLGQQVVERIHRNPWTGFSVVGYVDDNADRLGKAYLEAPVLGKIDERKYIH